MRRIIFEKEIKKTKNQTITNWAFKHMDSDYDRMPNDYTYQIKLISEDIEEIEREIAELRPLANRLNKLRKELKDYEALKSLLTKENNKRIDEQMNDIGRDEVKADE